MKMAIASDHGGYELKEALKPYLESRGIEITDLGTDSAESADYPVYGRACAEEVASGRADKGIVCCGTGIGISMAANRVRGIRCALCTSPEMARLASAHNNANILALGGRILTEEEAIEIVGVWLDTDFEGGRHQNRIAMLDWE